MWRVVEISGLKISEPVTWEMGRSSQKRRHRYFVVRAVCIRERIEEVNLSSLGQY